jgi:hypothetical protein
MKTPKGLFSTLSGLLFFGAAHFGYAQTRNFPVATFDTEDEVFAWMRWWGAAPQMYEFDPAVDAGGSATSGSLKATIDFDRTVFGGGNQFAVIGAFLDAQEWC